MIGFLYLTNLIDYDSCHLFLRVYFYLWSHLSVFVEGIKSAIYALVEEGVS